MLTIAEFAAAKKFSVDALKAFGVRQGSSGLEIPYYTEDGQEAPRVRFRSAIAAKDGSTWSTGTEDLIPYGLHRPVAWDKGYVLVVEGETDCWALWTAGKPALGVPGAQNTKCLKLEHVTGAETIYVVREPGVAGARFPHRVASRLYDLGYTGTVYAIDLDAKDPHELWAKDPVAFEISLRGSVHQREEMPRPQKIKANVSGVSSLASILVKPRSNTRYIIDGMLPTGGILLIPAAPKTGKSQLIRNMALCVARGVPFLGRETTQGAVLWARLEEQYGPFIDDLVAMGATDVANQFFTNESTPPQDALPWLATMVAEHRPALVVIDTWARCTRVENINSYSEVNRATEALLRLSRDHGVAQVWIHHSNKGDGTDGAQVLGSTALFAACDTMLSIKRYPNDTRTVWTRQRVGEDMEETPIVMDPETKLITIATGKSGLRNGQTEAAVLAALADSAEGWLFKKDLLEQLKLRRSDVLAALVSLELRQLIVCTGDGHSNDPTRVSLVIRHSQTDVSSLAAYRVQKQSSAPQAPPSPDATMAGPQASSTDAIANSRLNDQPPHQPSLLQRSQLLIYRSAWSPGNHATPQASSTECVSLVNRIGTNPRASSTAVPRASSVPQSLYLVPNNGNLVPDLANLVPKLLGLVPQESLLVPELVPVRQDLVPEKVFRVPGLVPEFGKLVPRESFLVPVFPNHQNQGRFLARIRVMCVAPSRAIVTAPFSSGGTPYGGPTPPRERSHGSRVHTHARERSRTHTDSLARAACPKFSFRRILVSPNSRFAETVTAAICRLSAAVSRNLEHVWRLPSAVWRVSLICGVAWGRA